MQGIAWHTADSIPAVTTPLGQAASACAVLEDEQIITQQFGAEAAGHLVYVVAGHIALGWNPATLHGVKQSGCVTRQQ